VLLLLVDSIAAVDLLELVGNIVEAVAVVVVVLVFYCPEGSELVLTWRRGSQ
jgi:hypothetical protein